MMMICTEQGEILKGLPGNPPYYAPVWSCNAKATYDGHCCNTYVSLTMGYYCFFKVVITITITTYVYLHMYVCIYT